MTGRNHGAFPGGIAAAGTGILYTFARQQKCREVRRVMRRTSRHLLFGTYNYGCVSGMARRIRKAAAVRQRYNTLDFASKVVCQQGCCSPLLETQSLRGFHPGSPLGLPGGGCLYGENGWASHSRQRERWGDWLWWMGTQHGRRSQKATCTGDNALENVDCAISMYFAL